VNKGRYIITGAPSTGKSTVVNELNSTYETFPEVARAIIQQELATNSKNVPWLDNYEFSKLVINQQIEDFEANNNSITFYDRGIPDVIAYLKYYQQAEFLDEFINQAKEYRYAKKVFLMPPWERIYQKDEERRENFKEAILLNDKLITSYDSLGYEIIEVPFVNPKERVKFILDQINF
jgi:predicted ATPase